MKRFSGRSSFLLLVLVACVSCKNSAEEVKNHRQQVEAFRAQKDEDYKIPEKTMLTDALMETFTGLKYFPVDFEYNVFGTLTRLENLPKIKIKTSTGKIADYVIYGKLSFRIDKEPYELSAYQSARLVGTDRKKGVLFIPFTDETSGKTTYGGGRYIVLDIPEGNQIGIDFNMAYNPFCVYDPEHSCPIPPAENHLDVEIPVGEMMY